MELICVCGHYQSTHKSDVHRAAGRCQGNGCLCIQFKNKPIVLVPELPSPEEIVALFGASTSRADLPPYEEPTIENHPAFKTLVEKFGKGWYMWHWTLGLSRTAYIDSKGKVTVFNEPMYGARHAPDEYDFLRAVEKGYVQKLTPGPFINEVK